MKDCSDFKSHVDSGEYYKDAVDWYNTQYIQPLSERSVLALLTTGMAILLLGLIINMYYMFPLNKELKYIIKTVNIFRSKGIIQTADSYPEKPLRSIAKILVENYVVQREIYNYDKLEEQLRYVTYNSTRFIFKGFYNYLSIENNQSPVLRYQKNVIRKIEIVKTEFKSDKSVIVTFRSTAVDKKRNKSIENLLWKAMIRFNIDEIDYKVPYGTKFNFKVTNYQLKLLKQYKVKAQNEQ